MKNKSVPKSRRIATEEESEIICREAMMAAWIELRKLLDFDEDTDVRKKITVFAQAIIAEKRAVDGAEERLGVNHTGTDLFHILCSALFGVLFGADELCMKEVNPHSRVGAHIMALCSAARLMAYIEDMSVIVEDRNGDCFYGFFYHADKILDVLHNAIQDDEDDLLRRRQRC